MLSPEFRRDLGILLHSYQTPSFAKSLQCTLYTFCINSSQGHCIAIMPSDQFDESNTIISYVNTVVTLLGVIWALWTAAWHLNFNHTTKHLGSICQDEDLMGWFVAKLLGWWTRIFPFHIRRVPIPQVPGISTCNGLDPYLRLGA